MNAVEYIHSLKAFGKKAELKNIENLMNCLGNPQNGLKYIHIAGTNGKGSVSSMLNSIFLYTGKKVGLFTSPFIESFNERICVNNVPISDGDLERITIRVKKEVEYLAVKGIFCTVFDVICAVGFVYFKEQKCDIVVLEVGLGGRFDATNIIKDPLCAAICAIGYDHTEYLGETLSQIAFEKCGIIKSQCPVVSYPKQQPEASYIIAKACKDKKTPCIIPDLSKLMVMECNERGSKFLYEDNEYSMSLAGEYQVYNALCAIEVAKLCGVDNDIIKNGIKKALWKCRFEVFYINNKTVILDGAHNPHGISAFCSSVNNFFSDKKVHYVFGMVDDKDIEKSCSEISKAKSSVTVTSVPSARSCAPEKVYEILCSVSQEDNVINYIDDNIEAIKYALSADNDVVCVCGSLYMVGSVRKHVEMLSQTDKTR